MNFIQRHFWRKHIKGSIIVFVKFNKYEMLKAEVVLPLMNGFALVKTLKYGYTLVKRKQIYPL